MGETPKFGLTKAIQEMRTGHKLRIDGHDGWVDFDNSTHWIRNNGQFSLKSIVFYNEDLSVCKNQEEKKKLINQEEIFSF